MDARVPAPQGEKLLLVALDDPGTHKRLGLDGRIETSGQYPTTQRWVLALYSDPLRREVSATSRTTRLSSANSACAWIALCGRA